MGGLLDVPGNVVGLGSQASLQRDPYYYTDSRYFWAPAAAVVSTDGSLAARSPPDRVTVVRASGPDHGRPQASAVGAETRAVLRLREEAFYDSLLVVFVHRGAQLGRGSGQPEVSVSQDRLTTARPAEPACGVFGIDLANLGRGVAGLAVARIEDGRSVRELDRLLEAVGAGAAGPQGVKIALQVKVAAGHSAKCGIRRSERLVVVGRVNLGLRRLASFAERA